MKTVYIVAGSNGAGKTTFAKEFITTANIPFLNADEIAKELNPSDQEGGKLTAGRIFFARLDELIERDSSFVVESTLSGLYITNIINSLKQKGFKIVILYVFVLTPQAAIERVELRFQEGGHFVPKEDILRRYKRSKNNFWNLYKSKSDYWSLHYNGNENQIQIAFGRDNDVTVIDSTLFENFLNEIKL